MSEMDTQDSSSHSLGKLKSGRAREVGCFRTSALHDSYITLRFTTLFGDCIKPSPLYLHRINLHLLATFNLIRTDTRP